MLCSPLLILGEGCLSPTFSERDTGSSRTHGPSAADIRNPYSTLASRSFELTNLRLKVYQPDWASVSVEDKALRGLLENFGLTGFCHDLGVPNSTLYGRDPYYKDPKRRVPLFSETPILQLRVIQACLDPGVYQRHRLECRVPDASQRGQVALGITKKRLDSGGGSGYGPQKGPDSDEVKHVLLSDCLDMLGAVQRCGAPEHGRPHSRTLLRGVARALQP